MIFVLLAGAEPQIVEDYRLRHPNQPLFNALIQASGKMVLVDKLLTKLKESGHKVSGCVGTLKKKKKFNICLDL